MIMADDGLLLLRHAFTKNHLIGIFIEISSELCPVLFDALTIADPDKNLQERKEEGAFWALQLSGTVFLKS